MKISKISATVLLLVVAGMLSIGCASQSDSSPVSENQTVTVRRGDIKIDIMASGNLIATCEANLNFGSAGLVEQVLVQIGDSVEEGQVLAKLDTLALEKSLVQARANVKMAQLNLERAEEPTTSASGTEILAAPDPLDIEIKELQLESANLSLKEAEIQLEDATIVAPFAGLVAEVNVSVDDWVSDSTVAVRLIDPTQFEVEVLVNEMEIYQLEVGAQATVQVDAMRMIVLPAKVAHISPSAVIQSGVVNYTIEIEIEPLESVLDEHQETMQEATPDATPMEQIRQAIEEGRITQEQAKEMVKQRIRQIIAQAIEEGRITQEEVKEMVKAVEEGRITQEQFMEMIGQLQQQKQGEQQGTSSVIPEDFQLKEGLTVTVSMLVAERNDVLLIPNNVIIYEGKNVIVQVLEDGAIEQRSIKTGLSDWQYTEVTDGLSEGEKVVVDVTTPTTPTTSQQGARPGGIQRMGGTTR